jgi:hypothetical protein
MENENKIQPQLTEYQIKIRAWCQKLDLIKPAFDKARKEDYGSALKIWEEHLDIGYDLLSWNDELTEVTQHIMQDGYHIDGKDIYNKNIMVLIPINDGERELFNLWYRECYTSKILVEWNFEIQREKILKQLNETENKIEYLESLVKDSDEQTRTRFLGDDPLNRRNLIYTPLNNSVFTKPHVDGVIYSPQVNSFRKNMYLDKWLQNKEPNWQKATIETVRIFCEVNFLIQQKKFLKEKLNEIQDTPHETNIEIKLKMKKLKWNCSPSILGYLITELAKKGFIEYPLRGGEPNYTGLAKLCLELFDVETTPENLIREFNPNKMSLSETKRIKFRIPELSDVD